MKPDSDAWGCVGTLIFIGVLFVLWAHGIQFGSPL